MKDDQVQPYEDDSLYMGRRYDEALAEMSSKLKEKGEEIGPYLQIYLVSFYHHGIKTGIESLYFNQIKANEKAEQARRSQEEQAQ